jgi:hypothetical protein
MVVAPPTPRSAVLHGAVETAAIGDPNESVRAIQWVSANYIIIARETTTRNCLTGVETYSCRSARYADTSW